MSWSGVFSGLAVGIGAVLLLSALGLAVGITAVGDPRTAGSETASSLGVGAGIWGAVVLLIAFFLAGMVGTRVANRPNPPGAVIHGVLVWSVFSMVMVWLTGSGVSLGLSGVFGVLGAITRGATAAAAAAVSSGGDLANVIGLNDPSRLVDRLQNPQTSSTRAAATGMPVEEARAALGDLRRRVEAVRDDPAGAAAEVRVFVAQYGDRVKARAMETAAAAQRGAKIGAWVSFAMLSIGLAMSIFGALSGVPKGLPWRPRPVS